SASDSDGDSIALLQFWDSGGDTTPLGAAGHYVLNGETMGENQAISVLPSQLSSLTFDSGSGSAQEWVRAYDGFQWSAWESFQINARVDSGPPSVSITNANASIAENQVEQVSPTLFTASDHSGASIQTYEFWQAQSTTGAHFDISGTPVSGYSHDID